MKRCGHVMGRWGPRAAVLQGGDGAGGYTRWPAGNARGWDAGDQYSRRQAGQANQGWPPSLARRWGERPYQDVGWTHARRVLRCAKGRCRSYVPACVSTRCRSGRLACASQACTSCRPRVRAGNTCCACSRVLSRDERHTCLSTRSFSAIRSCLRVRAEYASGTCSRVETQDVRGRICCACKGCESRLLAHAGQRCDWQIVACANDKRKAYWRVRVSQMQVGLLACASRMCKSCRIACVRGCACSCVQR